MYTIQQLIKILVEFMYLAIDGGHIWAHLSCAQAAHMPWAVFSTVHIWTMERIYEGGPAPPPPFEYARNGPYMACTVG